MTKSLDIAQFFDFTPQLCCVASVDGVFLRVNQAWETTLGYPVSALEGTPFLNFVHPDDHAKTARVMAQELATDLPLHDFENRYRHRDGSFRTLRWAAVKQPGDNLIYAAADDVTDKAQLQNDLQAVQARYERTVTGSNDGLWEWEIAANHFWLSPRAQELLRAPTGIFNFAQLRAGIFADDLAAFDAAWVAQLKQHIPLNIECRFTWGTNQYRWLRLRARLFDKDDLPHYLAGSIIDIHDEKLTQLELKFTQELLTESQELARLGSWQYDIKSDYLFWSREVYAIFGRDPALGPPQGDTQYKYFLAQDVSRLQHAMQQAMQGVSYKIEVGGRREDGRAIRLRSLGRPLLDADGTVALIMGTLQDVTDWHQLASERDTATLANQMKSQFLTNISHEVRTPMNAIVGMTQVLMHGQLSQQQQEQCRIIMTGAKDMLTIINDLLDLAKAESGQMGLEEITFDLYDMLRDVAALHAARIYDKGLEMVVDIAANVPRTVTGDPLRLKQIIGNLIGNAVKFTRRGHIMLSVADEGGLAGQHVLKFTVSDTGIGIPAEKLPFVFDKFTQANAATAREYGGTGLGLSICQELVGLMGGQISVNSEAGQGTRFTFEIPLPVYEHTPVNLAQIHAVIFEPYAPAAGALATFLTAAGARVTWAAALADLPVLLTQPGVTHALFTDVDDSALPLAESLALDPRTAAIPRIIMALPTSQTGQLPPLTSLIIKPCFLHELGYALAPPPLVLQDAQEQALIATAAPDPLHNIDAVRVLLVEDNRMNQAVFKHVFDLLGCRIMVAENGQVALDVVAEDDFDLILMDICMPVMDGLTAARELVARMHSGAVKTIPIIGLTGNATDIDDSACYAAGMQDILHKPLLLDDLTAVLRKYALRMQTESGGEKLAIRIKTSN